MFTSILTIQPKTVASPPWPRLLELRAKLGATDEEAVLLRATIADFLAGHAAYSSALEAADAARLRSKTRQGLTFTQEWSSAKDYTDFEHALLVKDEVYKKFLEARKALAAHYGYDLVWSQLQTDTKTPDAPAE